MCAKISDRKGWIHDTEENTLLLVWKREEIQISFKVHKELALCNRKSLEKVAEQSKKSLEKRA